MYIFRIMITIMEGRLKSIESSVEIFRNTGKLFLQVDGSNNIIPVDGMNFGLFYLASITDKLFNISPSIFIHFLFSSIILISIIIIFYLLNLFFNNKKIFITIFSLNLIILIYIFKKIYYLNIEYLLYFLPPVITILFVESIKLKQIKYNSFILYFLFLLYLLCESIKTYSSLGAIIYFFVFILFENKKKNIIIFSLIFVFIFSFSNLINYTSGKIQKKNYYELFDVNYEIDYLVGASKWQAAYLGLSYISNAYVDNFDDNVTSKFLKSKNKNYKIINTHTHEKILKDEILRIIKKDKGFFFRLMSAKIGTILAWVALFANISLIYFFSFRLENYKKFGILLCFTFYSVFPIMTIPVTFYITGIIGTSLSLFNLMMIDRQFQNTLKKIYFFFRLNNS